MRGYGDAELAQTRQRRIPSPVAFGDTLSPWERGARVAIPATDHFL
jgi:hypothetical protein